MQKLEKSLAQLGFSDKKAKVYVALLELGEATIIGLAHKTGLKRTTVYNIVPELIQQGLIKTAVKRKHRFFYIENPNVLKQEAVQRVQLVDYILPELRAIHNVLPNKPRITFYEGVGGMKDLYQDTLDSLSPGSILLSYTGLTDFSQMMPQDYYEYYVAERVKRRIKINILAPDSAIAREWNAKSIQDLREVKIIKNTPFQFNADTEIYANKVALISYRDNFMGVIIESKEINQMQRMAFEVMWKSL